MEMQPPDMCAHCCRTGVLHPWMQMHQPAAAAQQQQPSTARYQRWTCTLTCWSSCTRLTTSSGSRWAGWWLEAWGVAVAPSVLADGAPEACATWGWESYCQNGPQGSLQAPHQVAAAGPGRAAHLREFWLGRGLCERQRRTCTAYMQPQPSVHSAVASGLVWGACLHMQQWVSTCLP